MVAMIICVDKSVHLESVLRQLCQDTTTCINYGLQTTLTYFWIHLRKHKHIFAFLLLIDMEFGNKIEFLVLHGEFRFQHKSRKALFSLANKDQGHVSVLSI